MALYISMEIDENPFSVAFDLGALGQVPVVLASVRCPTLPVTLTRDCPHSPF